MRTAHNRSPDYGVSSSGKLKILFILPDLSGGGAERTVVNLLNHIDRERFVPFLGLLSPQGNYLNLVNPTDIKIATLPGWLKLSLDLPGNSLHSLALSSLLPRLMRIPASIYQIRSFVQLVQPDIVLTSMTGLNILTSIALLGGRKHQFGWIAREGNNFKANLQQLVKNKLLQQLLLKIIHRSYHRANHVLTLSKGSAEELITNFHLNPDKVSHIYNPIYLEQIQQTLQQPSASKPLAGHYIVTMGRLHPQKGFEYLIQAVQLCHKHHGLKDLQLIILGEGTHRPALEEQIQTLNLQNHVKLVGFVDNPWSYVAAAQAFVLPSLWEGFAHVVVEAMACQVPLIVSDCDYGPKEIITHQETGLLVPMANPDALARAIHQLLSHPDKTAHLVQNASIRAQDFDAPKITRDYESLFSSVCS